MNQNYSIVPCFIEKNPKKHLKFMSYQNKVCGFSLQIPIIPTFLQTLCLKIPPYFLEL
jgi:hypothetical protein